MSAVPDVLLWVDEVGFSDRRGANVLSGHDFRPDFGWRGGDFPSQLFVLRGTDRLVLRSVHISHVHRLNKSWAWETDTPERFPEPPYLLTDDSGCRLAFAGPVRYDPTAQSAEWIDGLFTLLEDCGDWPVPLLGRGWFGVLQVERSSPGTGQLSAFTREAVRVDGVVEAEWADGGQPFGRVVVPAGDESNA